MYLRFLLPLALFLFLFYEILLRIFKNRNLAILVATPISLITAYSFYKLGLSRVAAQVFKFSFFYVLVSLILIAGLYFLYKHLRRWRKGIEKIFVKEEEKTKRKKEVI